MPDPLGKEPDSEKKEYTPEECAPIIAEHVKKARDHDFWLACFSAALDEGVGFEEALKLADEADGAVKVEDEKNEQASA